MVKRFGALLATCCVLSSLASACAGDPEKEKRAYLESGNRYFDKKQWSEAVIEYRNAIKVDPSFGDARYKLSEALMEADDPGGAAQELIRAADLLPQRLDVQLRAGSVLLLLARFDDAKVRAEKALALEPNSVSAQILKANALAGLKDFQNALLEIQAALDLEPDRSASYTALGTVQMARGKAGEAEAAFKRAVELDSKSVNAHLALAGFYWTAARLQEAEAQFQAARTLEPSNALANRGLASFYLGSSRAAAAEPFLKALADRGTAADKVSLADYYVSMNRFEDALRTLQPIESSSTDGVSAILRVASIKYLQKDPKEAYRVVDEVLEKYPNRPEPLLAKARFLLADQKLQPSLDLAVKATQADPASIGAHYLVGTLEASLGRPLEASKAFARVLELNPRAVAAQVRMAELELARGDSASSLQHAQDAVIAQPQNAVARLILAKSHLAENNLPAAQRELDALLKSYPKWADVHAQYGALLLRRRDVAKARNAFDTAIALDSKSSEALAGLVALDVLDGKPADAQARVEARVAMAPKDASTQLMSARSYMLLKDYSRAEQALKSALQLAPNDMRAYADLVRLYLVSGRLEDGLRSLSDLADKDPAMALQARTMEGVILQTQNRNDEAMKKYEAVLASNKEQAVAANNLAWMYAERGQELEAALQMALTAKQRLPDQPAVSDTLGFVYLKMGSADLAATALREAVAKDPDNPGYRMRLGLALARSGKSAEARRELGAALKASPQGPEAAAARAALASLDAAKP